MDGSSVLLAHFVKLVDQTNAFISQNQSASLKFPLLRVAVLPYRCRKPHRRCASARCVNASAEYFLQTFEKLGFGDAWIAH